MQLRDVKLSKLEQVAGFHLIRAKDAASGEDVALIGRRADGVYFPHVYGAHDRIHGFDKPLGGIPCESIQAARHYIRRAINGQVHRPVTMHFDGGVTIRKYPGFTWSNRRGIRRTRRD